jgi:hypothetical protein
MTLLQVGDFGVLQFDGSLTRTDWPCAIECISMALDRLNTNFLYQLGRDLQEIELQATKQPRATLITPLARAGVYLDGFYTNRVFGKPLLPLRTSLRNAHSLRETLQKLLDSGKPENWSAPFSDDEVQGLAEKIRDFQTVFSADLGSAQTYIVRQPGILAVDSLIFGARAVFEGYEDRIPELGKWDTDQAGRCLAFDLPTAAGFHIARATEAVLLKYLEAWGKKIEKESQRNWGQYTRLLRETAANVKVVSAIDQIRELHRNPLLHPEDTLTMAEAMSLWAICCSTIQGMIADIEKNFPNPKPEIVEMLPDPTRG